MSLQCSVELIRVAPVKGAKEAARAAWQKQVRKYFLVPIRSLLPDCKVRDEPVHRF